MNLKRSEIIILCSLVVSAAGFLSYRFIFTKPKVNYGPCQSWVEQLCANHSANPTNAVACLKMNFQSVHGACRSVLANRFPDLKPKKSITKAKKPSPHRKTKKQNPHRRNKTATRAAKSNDFQPAKGVSCRAVDLKKAGCNKGDYGTKVICLGQTEESKQIDKAMLRNHRN